MKRFLPAVLLVLLVAVAGWYALTRVDTSDWKTYSNTNYGYRIEYPSRLNVGSISEGGISLIEAFDHPDVVLIGKLDSMSPPIEFDVTAYSLSGKSPGNDYYKEIAGLVA